MKNRANWRNVTHRR